MLEAEISPLFGLTLIELVEYVAIGAIGIAAAGLQPLALIDASVGPVSVRAEGITDDQATILATGIIFLGVGAILRSKGN